MDKQYKWEFVFKYTPEFVARLDCKNASDEFILHHCVKKWDEVIAAHEAGVSGICYDYLTCPACQKYDGCDCLECPLNDRKKKGHVCFDEWQLYRVFPSTATAIAVRDYIQGKLDEIRKPQGKPQIGDKVHTCQACRWWERDRKECLPRMGDCSNPTVSATTGYYPLRTTYDFGCIFHVPKEEQK